MKYVDTVTGSALRRIAPLLALALLGCVAEPCPDIASPAVCVIVPDAWQGTDGCRAEIALLADGELDPAPQPAREHPERPGDCRMCGISNEVEEVQVRVLLDGQVDEQRVTAERKKSGCSNATVTVVAFE